MATRLERYIGTLGDVLGRVEATGPDGEPLVAGDVIAWAVDTARRAHDRTPDPASRCLKEGAKK